MQMSDRIGRRIKLQDVHILMAVVQAGSMGKAARHLNTSQPNISKSIADLEHALGVPLLDRHRQGVEPTAYGRALLDCGTAAFDDLRQGVKNIEFLADPATGEARVGGNPFLASTFACAVVDRLSRRYPRMMFHVEGGPTEPLFGKLIDRNLDLVITWKFGTIDERLEFEFLFDDSPFLVVAGARSPWVRRRRIELGELANEPWVLSPPDTVARSIQEAFLASGLPYPRATVFAGLVESRMNLIASGRFLTIFPPSVLRWSTGRRKFKVLPVELPSAPVSVGIVTLKNRTLSPAARLFIEHAREVAKLPAKKKG
jgi:DNA-binding transcriptional LysR family regulator